jgi:hypothetical protein
MSLIGVNNFTKLDTIRYIHPSQIVNSNNIWWKILTLKLPVMRFLPISDTLPYSDLNILTRILFLNTLNQASPLRHEVTSYSHPCKRAVSFPRGVRLSPLGTAATTGLLYLPRMIDDGDCGAIGGMKIVRGNRSTRRKPARVPLCTHDQTRARTRAAVVGSWRLTAWGMARPKE